MKAIQIFLSAIPCTLLVLTSGCSTSGPVTNGNQPGPAVGRAIGTGVGAVGGNAAGAVVGFGEGVVAGTAASFDTTTRTVRQWKTETTADGRTIQVPVDIVVDQYGRPVGQVKTAK